MTVRVGINGFGRIGRNFFRAVRTSGADIDVVAVNDPADRAALAHLLQFDSILGRLDAPVELSGRGLRVGGQDLAVTAAEHPGAIDWTSSGADIVLEATGHFTDGPAARAHVDSGGAHRVVLSAPGTGVDRTVVMGVNHDSVRPEDVVVSNASCTTNCLAPMAKVLHDGLGIESGLMTTIHAYTADQNLHDNVHRDLRRARAAALNVVPTSTGAARALGQVLPELDGKLDGFAMRVPIPTGSAVDLTVTTSTATTVDEVNALFAAAAQGAMARYVTYSTAPLVSSDIVTDPASCTFDAPMTMVLGRQVKVVGWYDNEWGYANRLVDLVTHLGSHPD